MSNEIFCFCEENEKRICCFCVLECIKARKIGYDDYPKYIDAEEMYRKSCRMIYGEETCENLVQTYESSRTLTRFLTDEKYDETSYMALLECYKPHIDETSEDILTESLYQQAIKDMKYRPMDMHEEFAEIVLKHSNNSSFNFEIMHDYVAIVRR